MGTPELARTVLHELAEDPSLEIILVVAQPDRPAGRGLPLQMPPVKQEARARHLPVLQPEKARDPDFIATLRDLAPDLIVVAAYGQLLPPALLEIPRRACLNVHLSLLPRWRGAAPIAWAIIAGDVETGVTLMRMDAGLDTGDVVAQETLRILDSDTTRTLQDKLGALGASLLLRTLPAWLAGELTPRPQPSIGATHARKMTREDGRLNWHQPAIALWRLVRGLNPWPGAFTTCSEGAGAPVHLKVWEASPVAEQGPPGVVLRADNESLVVGTGQDALRLLVVQREGRRRLDIREFMKAKMMKPGMALGAVD
jgi:methionyl-tRNA formyltransferase